MLFNGYCLLTYVDCLLSHGYFSESLPLSLLDFYSASTPPGIAKRKIVKGTLISLDTRSGSMPGLLGLPY